MKTNTNRAFLKAMAVLAAIAITFSSVFAGNEHKTEAGSLSIEHPWARPTLGNVKLSAVYMQIRNTGKEDDTLLSVSTDIANRSELHETVQTGDFAKMQPIVGGVKIPAAGSAQFVPLGKHIMIMGLTKKLEVGDSFPLKLIFEKQGEVMINVKVTKPDTNASKHMKKGSHHGSHTDDK